MSKTLIAERAGDKWVVRIARDKLGRFVKGYPPKTAYTKGDIPWHAGTKGIKKASKTSFRKGHIPWIKGKHHSEETKRKINEAYKENGIGSKFSFGKRGENPNWKGGRRKNYAGYILILKPEHPFCDCTGYIFEHRLVIEQHLGRFLKPSEICHHINRIVDDNRPENLMVFKSKSAHNRFHKDPNNVEPEEIIFNGKEQVFRADVQNTSEREVSRAL